MVHKTKKQNLRNTTQYVFIVGIPIGMNCALLIADLCYTAMNLTVWLSFKKNIGSTH
jgi:hypothetical protein